MSNVETENRRQSDLNAMRQFAKSVFDRQIEELGLLPVEKPVQWSDMRVADEYRYGLVYGWHDTDQDQICFIDVIIPWRDGDENVNDVVWSPEDFEVRINSIPVLKY